MASVDSWYPQRLPQDVLLRSVVAFQAAALGAGDDVAARIERFRRDHAVWIVAIVALALLGALGILTFAMIKCRARGGSYTGGVRIVKKSWFTVWLGMSCSR